MNTRFSLLTVYSTNPISLTARQSVARLLAQRLAWLTTEYPDCQLQTVCPPQVAFDHYDRLKRKLTKQSESAYLSEKAVRLGARKLSAPDIVLCVTAHAVRAARRQFPQARIIYWIHSLPTLGQEALALAAIETASAVVVASAALYQSLWLLCERKGFPAPVWLIPYSIDNTTLFKPPTKDEKAEQRAKLSIEQDTLAIVHAGGGQVHKGRQVVVQALRLCDDLQRNVVLFSAGAGEPRRTRLAPHLELVETGPLDPAELARLYQACDIGVVPSVWFETVSLVLLEMMSSGLPVIASNAGGIPEVVCDTQNGLLVALPNSVLEWEAKLRLLLSGQINCARLCTQAREDSLRFSYTNPEISAAWRKLFTSLTATT
jgi:glycosyltransferase involved in cell wall biosynthesis